MIVHTMSFEQMFNEVLKERNELDAKAKAQVLTVRRKFLATNQQHANVCVELFTIRKNHYFVFYELHRDIHLATNITYLLHTNDNNGFRTIELMVTEDEFELEINTGHFYRRYNERCNLGYVKPFDMIKHFHKNFRYIGRGTIEKLIEGQPTKIVTRAESGVIIGLMYMEKNVTVNKTFITYNMLFDDQKDILAYLQKSKHITELLKIDDSMEQKMDDERKNWMAHR